MPPPGYFPSLRKLGRLAGRKSSIADAFEKIADTAYMLLEARRRMDAPPKVNCI